MALSIRVSTRIPARVSARRNRRSRLSCMDDQRSFGDQRSPTRRTVDEPRFSKNMLNPVSIVASTNTLVAVPVAQSHCPTAPTCEAQRVGAQLDLLLHSFTLRRVCIKDNPRRLKGEDDSMKERHPPFMKTGKRAVPGPAPMRVPEQPGLEYSTGLAPPLRARHGRPGSRRVCPEGGRT